MATPAPRIRARGCGQGRCGDNVSGQRQPSAAVRDPWANVSAPATSLAIVVSGTMRVVTDLATWKSRAADPDPGAAAEVWTDPTAPVAVLRHPPAAVLAHLLGDRAWQGTLAARLAQPSAADQRAGHAGGTGQGRGPRQDLPARLAGSRRRADAGRGGSSDHRRSTSTGIGDKAVAMPSRTLVSSSLRLPRHHGPNRQT